MNTYVKDTVAVISHLLACKKLQNRLLEPVSQKLPRILPNSYIANVFTAFVVFNVSRIFEFPVDFPNCSLALPRGFSCFSQGFPLGSSSINKIITIDTLPKITIIDLSFVEKYIRRCDVILLFFDLVPKLCGFVLLFHYEFLRIYTLNRTNLNWILEKHLRRHHRTTQLSH